MGESLGNHLERFREFLSESLDVPAVADFRVFESNSGPADCGKYHIRRGELVTPSEYEARFKQLTEQGFPWLNIECFGIYEASLIVRVRTPDYSVQGAQTSVNYSGPTRRVVQADWDASVSLTIE